MESGSQSWALLLYRLPSITGANGKRLTLHSQQEIFSTLLPQQEEESFLPAQSQPRPTVRMVTTQPTRNHHSPEPLLSSSGLSFKATPPKSPPFSKNNIPLLCWLDLPLVFVMVSLSRVAVLCYSGINPFCW